MLPDSAHLQQVEAERAERLGRDFRAVYSLQDARDTLRQIRVVRYEETFSPARGIDACLLEAGHILGSAIVTLTVSDQGHRTRVVCSGDLGQPGRPIVRDPAVVTDADVLLLESTYGNRNHRSLGETLDELVAALRRALDERHGIVLVPAFAVGRTQEFLYYLRQLRREGRIPPVHVFVDSPMATEVTEITARHLELFDEEARQLARSPTTSGDGLSLAFTGDVQESMALNRLESGTIIVAASGMCDGGRIRHHLRQRLSNPRTTVLIVGFQAAGTLGRRLVDRAPSVRIMGQDVPVRAEIVTLGGFSAHADQRALLDWLRHFRRTPREVFLVHGEPENAAALAAAMRAQLGWATRIPAHGESVVLTCDDR
jgi:metallo-beta-lactamase family protein